MSRTPTRDSTRRRRRRRVTAWLAALCACAPLAGCGVFTERAGGGWFVVTGPRASVRGFPLVAGGLAAAADAVAPVLAARGAQETFRGDVHVRYALADAPGARLELIAREERLVARGTPNAAGQPATFRPYFDAIASTLAGGSGGAPAEPPAAAAQ